MIVHRRITQKNYLEMENIQKGYVFRDVIEFDFIGEIESEGITYVELENPINKKRVLVEKELYDVIINGINNTYKILMEGVPTGYERTDITAVVSSRVFNTEQKEALLEVQLKKQGERQFNELMQGIYGYGIVRGLRVDEEIDFGKYISLEEMYEGIICWIEDIIKSEDGSRYFESQEEKNMLLDILRGKIERVREEWERKARESKGLEVSIKRKNREQNMILIDTVLKNILKSSEKEQTQYVNMLRKIQDAEENMAYLIEYGLLSFDDIGKLYRIAELTTKIDKAVKRLSAETKKKVIDVVEQKEKKTTGDITATARKGDEESENSTDALLKNILNSQGHTQEEYIKRLRRNGIKPEDIAGLIETGIISYEDVARLFEIKELSRIVSRAVGRLNLSSAIKVFEASGNIYILNFFDWSQVNAEKLREIRRQETEINALIIAKVIVRMHQSRNITMSDLEISSIFAYDDINDRLRAYFELVKNSLYHEDSIIALWNEKVHENNSENPYEQQVSEDVTVEELLGFFKPDKIIAKMEGYCNPNLPDQESKKENEGKTEDLTYDVGSNEFLIFYRGILEGNRIKDEEKTAQIIVELESKLAKKMIEGMAKRDATYLLAAVQLLEKKVITTENMQEILSEKNQEKLIEMYGQGVDDKTLLSLFKYGLVQEYILELVYQDIGKEEWVNKIQNNSIGIEDIVILCSLEILDKEHIKGIKFETIDWESLSTHLDETKLKNLIELLYLNRNIGFEEIKELKNMGILSGKEAETLLEQIDLEGILRKGLTSEDGQGVKGKTKVKEGSKKTEENGLPDREVLLRDLGFKPITDKKGNVLVVSKGSFKGYKIYMDVTRKYKVILLEKDIHASTFAMNEAKAGEYFREEEETTSLVGSRSDWRENSRTEGSVIARLHTVNWGPNIIETIVDISSIFKFDDENERRKYVKEETKRLCEENKDSIEYLRIVKEEARRAEEQAGS